ncbi:hypothetical protein AAG906_018791 [Vitis piasezkii]
MENSRGTRLQQRKGRRLVLFPLPLKGHLNPMLELANILHSKGFSITIIHTHFNAPNSDDYPHFTFHPISDGLSEGEASTGDILHLLLLLTVNCVEPFRDCLARLLSNVSEEPVACLVADAIWHFSRLVADSLKLPTIVLRTSSASSFLVFGAFPLLREKGYLPIQDSRLEEPLQEFPPLRIKDIPAINTCELEAFYQLVAAMVNESKASSGIIWNSFEDLEQSALATIHQDFHIPIFPIGPFHKYSPTSTTLSIQDHSSIAWLDTQAPNSVVYVSFGSIAGLDETDFIEMAWGLANSKQPFLWVVRPGFIRGSEWLEPLPSGFLETIGGRGHIVKWAPQHEVLAHPAVGAFCTHSGWNSTLESISEGVPMICLPCFSDQKVNARYVSQVWRVGVQLENGLKRGEIEGAIRRLMVEKSGQEIRDRCIALKEKANLCLKQGGSSYQTLEDLISYISSFFFQFQATSS